MGIFYDRSEKFENGKNYLVLKAKPISNYVFLVVALVLSVLYSMLKYDKISASSPYFLVLVASFVIFLIMMIITTIERREVAFDFFSLKTIIKKGKSIFHYSNPLEMWIEK